MRVLFLGTPDFACPSLEALVRADHEVVGVVTRADKPAGRGRKLVPPPVKVLAEQYDLPVYQPAKVNAAETVDTFRALEPDVVVVVAFGAILRRPLLNLAPAGAVNVHASLLPAYRGVAPAQWALIHGQRVTGVTTMLMDEGVDTGPVLRRLPVETGVTETAGELLARLATYGGDLLVETLEGLADGTVLPVAQPEEGASYAPRLERVHGYLDLSRTADQVVHQFRGTTPAPGARMFLGNEAILVRALRAVPHASGAPYGILEIASRHIRVGTGKGAIELLSVRPPGKNDMDGAAFAHGRHLAAGDRFSPPPEIPDLSVRVIVPR